MCCGLGCWPKAKNLKKWPKNISVLYILKSIYKSHFFPKNLKFFSKSPDLHVSLICFRNNHKIWIKCKIPVAKLHENNFKLTQNDLLFTRQSKWFVSLLMVNVCFSQTINNSNHWLVTFLWKEPTVYLEMLEEASMKH